MELNKNFTQNKDNNASNNIVKQRNKPTKKEYYIEEQLDILNKINNILGITENNNKFYLYDIQNNANIQKEIIDLTPSIKKYFKCGKWSVFFDKRCLNNPFLICKSIYKDLDYGIFSKAVDIVRNDIKIRTTQYTIIKNN